MWSKVTKYGGIFLIMVFSSISVSLSLNERGFTDENELDIFFKKIGSYTSFFEDRFYDVRMRKTLNKKAWDKRLVLADIDDYSLNKLGQWPVNRKTWTTMVNKLKHFGAKVIAFDVFFAEETKQCNGFSPDTGMAKSFNNFQQIPQNKIILPYSLYTTHSEHFKEIPDELYDNMITSTEAKGVSFKLSPISKSVYPIQVLLNEEPALGHIGAKADSDGIIRHYKLIANIDTFNFPSFALSAYEHYTGDKTKIKMDLYEEHKLTSEKGTIDLNHRGETKIRWSGGTNVFPRVPIYDIVSAKDDDKAMFKKFNNTIVFVASTAFGAHDLRHTPVDPFLPGVYAHMNMTKMLLEANFYKSKELSTDYSWAILFIGTGLFLIVQILGNPILDLTYTLVWVVGAYLLDTYFLLPKGYEIKLFFCLFSVTASYSWVTFLQFYLANKDKAFLKHAFGSYISPELIDDMYTTGEAPKLGGDSGIRTAFFTDIQGFSSFSEKLTPTLLVELLNEYLTAMTDILLHEKGTLDKYEGDAIIAFFGAPMPLDDHAERATRVAGKMQEKLLELREKWVEEGDKWPDIVKQMRMRVGINTGEIVTGNMGSRDRMNYTMMGDSVNLAARLEEAAKQYGIFNQISQYTIEAIDNPDKLFVLRELDTILVIGKTEPVTTYELMSLTREHSKSDELLKEKYEFALSLYKNMKWKEAKNAFSECLELEYNRFPELSDKPNPSKIYIQRCEEFIKNPPATDWDGVFELKTK